MSEDVSRLGETATPRIDSFEETAGDGFHLSVVVSWEDHSETLLCNVRLLSRGTPYLEGDFSFESSVTQL